jgi:hypothetical protein
MGRFITYTLNFTRIIRVTKSRSVTHGLDEEHWQMQNFDKEIQTERPLWRPKWKVRECLTLE